MNPEKENEELGKCNMKHELFAQSLGELYLLSNLGYLMHMGRACLLLCVRTAPGKMTRKYHWWKLCINNHKNKGMEDDVFRQEALHKSDQWSFKLVVHKDANSIQKNIWKLYIGVNLQHNCKKIKTCTTGFQF